MKSIIIILLAAILLAACAPSAPAQTGTPGAETETPTGSPSETDATATAVTETSLPGTGAVTPTGPLQTPGTPGQTPIQTAGASPAGPSPTAPPRITPPRGVPSPTFPGQTTITGSPGPTKRPTKTPTIHYITPLPTPIDPTCVQPDPEGPGQLSQSPFGNYPDAILEFLNRGASLRELDLALYDLGIANQPVAAAEADLTGDGKLDRVVSIYNPVSTSVPPGGTLLVYTCRSGRYVLSYRHDSEPPTGAAGIRLVQDLNADNSVDLVVGFPSCGEDACYERYQVLAWDGSQYTERLEGSSEDLPFPDLQAVDPNEDGVFNLEVAFSGVDQAGAGPQRTMRRVWTYRAPTTRWVPSEDIPDPPVYRIHALHDADRLVDAGRHAEALVLYNRVAVDETLQDFVDPALERANLGAYARYRMIVLYHLERQPGFAALVLEEMEDLYRVGSSQRSYVELARRFISGYGSGGIEGACRSARDYAGEHAAEILSPLGQESFGSGNKDYEPADVCSW